MALNVALGIYRGTRSDLSSLASTGQAGSIAWTTDTNELFVDGGSGTGIGAGNAWKKVAHDLVSVNSQVNGYTVQGSDRGKLISVNVTGGGPLPIITIPQATAQSGNFPVGWSSFIQNVGTSSISITPTTSTIDGQTALILTQYEGIQIVSDGTNYYTIRGVTSVPSGETFVQYASSATTNEFVTYVDSTGVIHYAQVGFSNLSGTLQGNQILQGPYGLIPTLTLGQMYFATDTNTLYFGTPGLGSGYILIGDVTDLQSQVEELQMKVRAQALALENIGIISEEFEGA